jgi:hypothetical protein
MKIKIKDDYFGSTKTKEVVRRSRKRRGRKRRRRKYTNNSSLQRLYTWDR